MFTFMNRVVEGTSQQNDNDLAGTNVGTNVGTNAGTNAGSDTVSLGILEATYEEAEQYLEKLKPNFHRYYKELNNNPVFQQNQTFNHMVHAYICENEFVVDVVKDSNKRYSHGVFLSDLWLNDVMNNNETIDSIEFIVVVDNGLNIEHEIEFKDNIDHFMESYKVNKFSPYMRFLPFNMNSFDYSVYIYTKNYIYYTSGYPFFYKEKSLSTSTSTSTSSQIFDNYVTHGKVFNIIRRNLIEMEINDQ